jgi:hypothetical protein
MRRHDLFIAFATVVVTPVVLFLHFLSSSHFDRIFAQILAPACPPPHSRRVIWVDDDDDDVEPDIVDVVDHLDIAQTREDGFCFSES